MQNELSWEKSTRNSSVHRSRRFNEYDSMTIDCISGQSAALVETDEQAGGQTVGQSVLLAGRRRPRDDSWALINVEHEQKQKTSLTTVRKSSNKVRGVQGSKAKGKGRTAGVDTGGNGERSEWSGDENERSGKSSKERWKIGDVQRLSAKASRLTVGK